MGGNPETPRRGVLLFVTPLAVLNAAVVFLLTDEWPISLALVEVGFTAIAFGLVVATVAPRRGAWGIRVVTLTIFLAYLSYLIYELWFSEQELAVSPPAKSTPFNAILGFLFFGVPCLIYTLWGSTWGRLGYVESGSANRTDVIVYLIAWGAQILFLTLSVLVVVVGIWRWWSVG
jgi:hypothetical protein